MEWDDIKGAPIWLTSPFVAAVFEARLKKYLQVDCDSFEVACDNATEDTLKAVGIFKRRCQKELDSR